MTDTHFEPFVHLAELGPDRALIAWGGFWFHRDDPAARWQIVDDSKLAELDPGRKESIGARSEPYGEAWAAGERWDWGPVPRGGLDLRPGGRSYDLSFRTFPDPGEHAALEFVVMGDYGVGVAEELECSRRQRRVAEVLDRLVEDGAAPLIVSLGDNG